MNSDDTNNNKGFSAEKFVDDLLNEGSKISCDETITEFEDEKLPKYYSKDKFKRAQKFFEDNIFALYFNKFLGLIVTLASPPVLDILRMTKMSGCVMSSYRRYMATLLHMNIWYRDELTTSSSSMKSIRKVKYMHNAASKKAISLGMRPITQKDMVLTQFGFMGFPVARNQMMGIHNPTDEELDSLVHFWRVIGHLMGIQERFNLCRESLEETKEICEVLINRVLRPTFQSKDEHFLKMTTYLASGMWHMVPLINYKTYMTHLNDALQPLNSNNEKIKTKTQNENGTPYFDLTAVEKFYLSCTRFILYTLKFKLIRLYFNIQFNITLWIMDNYPFLAVYNFGYKNALVRVNPHAKDN